VSIEEWTLTCNTNPTSCSSSCDYMWDYGGCPAALCSELCQREGWSWCYSRRGSSSQLSSGSSGGEWSCGSLTQADIDEVIDYCENYDGSVYYCEEICEASWDAGGCDAEACDRICEQKSFSWCPSEPSGPSVGVIIGIVVGVVVVIGACVGGICCCIRASRGAQPVETAPPVAAAPPGAYPGPPGQYSAPPGAYPGPPGTAPGYPGAPGQYPGAPGPYPGPSGAPPGFY
jgi:hypothetical protein